MIFNDGKPKIHRGEMRNAIESNDVIRWLKLILIVIEPATYSLCFNWFGWWGMNGGGWGWIWWGCWVVVARCAMRWIQIAVSIYFPAHGGVPIMAMHHGRRVVILLIVPLIILRSRWSIAHVIWWFITVIQEGWKPISGQECLSTRRETWIITALLQPENITQDHNMPLIIRFYRRNDGLFVSYRFWRISCLYSEIRSFLPSTMQVRLGLGRYR